MKRPCRIHPHTPHPSPHSPAVIHDIDSSVTLLRHHHNHHPHAWGRTCALLPMEKRPCRAAPFLPRLLPAPPIEFESFAGASSQSCSVHHHPFFSLDNHRRCSEDQWPTCTSALMSQMITLHAVSCCEKPPDMPDRDEGKKLASSTSLPAWSIFFLTGEMVAFLAQRAPPPLLSLFCFFALRRVNVQRAEELQPDSA